MSSKLPIFLEKTPKFWFRCNQNKNQFETDVFVRNFFFPSLSLITFVHKTTAIWRMFMAEFIVSITKLCFLKSLFVLKLVDSWNLNLVALIFCEASRWKWKWNARFSLEKKEAVNNNEVNDSYWIFYVEKICILRIWYFTLVTRLLTTRNPTGN